MWCYLGQFVINGNVALFRALSLTAMWTGLGLTVIWCYLDRYVFNGHLALSRASFFTTFLKDCGRGESLGTTTCLKPVVGGKQGHAPCRMQPLFVSVEFHGDHETVTELG